MKSRIPYVKPSITALVIEFATEAAENGWGENCYAFVNRFENSFKEHLGSQYAIATSSCTGALHMGMAALGVVSGDEVIMADANWIATASPIVHLGAKPIFVDIKPDTWCIDPQKAEAAITPNTKAIIAVHLYGNLCDMTELIAIGARHNIAVIEDAAEAVGSIYHGQRAGSMGTFGAFSFHGTKTLTTGEGGMFVTNDEALYERVLTLSNHGRAQNQTKQFWPEMVGFKYKMSNVQAAIGCAQMIRIDELISRKKEILASYRDRLQNFDEIDLNFESKGTVLGAWMPTAVYKSGAKVTRVELQQAFHSANIDARVFFWPLSSLPMFDKGGQALHAESIASRAINLPSFHDMTSSEMERVIETLISVSHPDSASQCD